MSSARLPADAAARARIVTELDRNLLVEAGAGSGKTHELTRRMAAGIASGAYELEGMAAITFMRKAAAELRGRFQLALEAELAAGGPAERQQRVRGALSNLERFFAGTIHSFCARLLRERPVEAGVSPGFTELDDVEEGLLRQQSWRDYRAQARAAGDADLLELIDAGVTAKQLDKAFERVCLHEDVDFPAADLPRPDAAEVWTAPPGAQLARAAAHEAGKARGIDALRHLDAGRIRAVAPGQSFLTLTTFVSGGAPVTRPQASPYARSCCAYRSASVSLAESRSVL
jgi:ATP-dependent helicase/nuclease subunit A